MAQTMDSWFLRSLSACVITLNRITYEEIKGDGVFVLWWNGQREATISSKMMQSEK